MELEVTWHPRHPRHPRHPQHPSCTLGISTPSPRRMTVRVTSSTWVCVPTLFRTKTASPANGGEEARHIVFFTDNKGDMWTEGVVPPEKMVMVDIDVGPGLGLKFP